MARKELHIVLNSERGGWDITKPHADRVSGHYETKKEAVEAGKKMAQNQGAEMITHLKNGQIQNPNSYGNDPCPPWDWKH